MESMEVSMLCQLFMWLLMLGLTGPVIAIGLILQERLGKPSGWLFISGRPLR